MAAFRRAVSLGLLPFVSLAESHLELPMPSIFHEPSYKGPQGNVGMAKYHHLLISFADWLLMSPVLFRHLKARGINVYLWVLNNEQEYERAFSLGASGVMT